MRQGSGRHHGGARGAEHRSEAPAPAAPPVPLPAADAALPGGVAAARR